MYMKSSPKTRFEIIAKTIANDNNQLNISELCNIAGVSRAGFYKYIKSVKKLEIKEQKDVDDFAIILDAYKHRGYNKGVRSIHMRLLHLDEPVVMNVKKIRRLMRKFNLNCPIRRVNPYRKRANAVNASRISPNILNREFKSHGARQVLLTDITYIPRYTHDNDTTLKYSYVCVIMDAYTKEILAYTTSSNIDTEFVLETVNKLIQRHGNELQTDVLIHSDQGCQYTSNKFVDILNSYRIRQSMSRRGNCWDNAPQESFFGHMKSELPLLPSDSHNAIVKKVDDWIEYYNNERYQWRLAKLSPSEYYTYTITGNYPIDIDTPSYGALPQTPEFNASVSIEDSNRKDDTN